MTDPLDEAHISAISPDSLCWDGDAVKRAPTKSQRARFRAEAMAWQRMSQLGGWAGFRSFVDQSADRRSRKKDPDRVIEIHGIAGAIGEQLALCWAGEQDTQRIGSSTTLGEEHRTLLLRSVSESASYFLLGAAHGLGNLVLRVALLEPSIMVHVQDKRPNASFMPGSNDRRAWLTLKEAASMLKAATGLSVPPNPFLSRCSDVINLLHADPRFTALDNRRGTDFHRLRPQSVNHTSPRTGITTRTTTTIGVSLSAPAFDPDSDGVIVHQVLIAGMNAVRDASQKLKGEIPKSMRRSGVWYHESFAPTRRLPKRTR